MDEIKNIETVYNGYRFRSRLEARWAVFFDALGVKYEYEPEGFKLHNGMYYLPDFRVKCHGTRGSCKEGSFDLWIEVKGRMSEMDKEKIIDFTHNLWDETCDDDTKFMEDCNHVLIVNKIPDEHHSSDSNNCGSYAPMDRLEIYPFNYWTIDGDYFAAYPAADENGRFYLWGDDSSYINKNDVDRVEKAYAKARQARFEHGETPKWHS